MIGFEKKVKNAFENSVYSSLLKNDFKIAVAVSGGADSVSLLVSLVSIFDNNRLEVITVNHNIRPKNESAGDCLFVQDLCKKLNVNCTIFEIEENRVQKLASERQNGIEEAARFLRYEVFDNFIEEKNAICLCLAHNQNDQLETLLMRFLQGSASEGLGGIKKERNKYFRPLLNISRSEIEQYLSEKNIGFVTDFTNFDDGYLRNKIRNNLIPLLDEKFDGWKTAVFTGQKKFVQDEKVLSFLSSKILWTKKNDDEIFTSVKIFDEDDAIIRRSIYHAFDELGGLKRVPFVFLEQVIKLYKMDKSFCLNCGEYVFEIVGDLFFIKKRKNSKTENEYFAIIEEYNDKIFIRCCLLQIDAFENGILLSNKDLGIERKLNVKFPCIVRSVCCGDKIVDSKGKMRDVLKILKNWHIPEDERKLVPVVEECGEDRKIVAVLASFLGYDDWIVKGV